MKSRGLGDSVHKFTKKTGIKKMVDTVSKGLKKACWKGYEAIGMKTKGGRKVPNCVPKKKKK